MGWLEERIITHVYKKEDGDIIHLDIPANEEPPDEFEGAKRIGFEPEQMGGYVRTKFERNGRVGYEYRQSGGKKRIVSATRERYEHNMGNMGSKALKEAGTKKNESVYTKSFGNAVEKAEHKKTAEFMHGLNKIQKGAK